MIKHIAAVAVVLSAGYASAAVQDAKYELKRIPMGPRNEYNYVLVRTDRTPKDDRPYALTGDRQERRAAERPAARPTPSHPKGTHGQY